MNEKINLGSKSLKFILDRNKQYIFPSFIILVCIIMFFKLLIPQFKSFLLTNQEAKSASLKLQILKENLNVLNSIDENSLEYQVGILKRSLPVEKDYSGILNSIYFAAQKSGVNLGNFSLQIGDLSRSENNEKVPTIRVSLPINNGAFQVSNFVQIISQTVPLSDVSFIKIGEAGSSVDVVFYYKPLDSAQSSIENIMPISQKGLELINKLSNFENVSSKSPSQ